MSQTDPPPQVLRCRRTLTPRGATDLTTWDHPGRRGRTRYEMGQSGTTDACGCWESLPASASQHQTPQVARALKVTLLPCSRTNYD